MLNNVAKANNCKQWCTMLSRFKKFAADERVSGSYIVYLASVLILQQVLHFCNSPGAM